MAQPKFLLIREIGAGLWNEIHHVLTQLLAAEIIQRIPVVYWGKGSLYSSSDGTNAFELFFQPISDYDIHDLAKKEFSFYPEGWNSENILMPTPRFSENVRHIAMEPMVTWDAEVCVSDNYIDVEKLIPFIPERHWLYGLRPRELLYSLTSKYIRLKADIQKSIDDFFNESMKDAPFLAVHIRSSDKISEVPHLNELNERYPQEIDKVLKANPGMRIFLMTDCIEILEEYRKLYGDILIHTDCRRVPRNGHGVHFQEYADNRLKGFEIIRDTWIAAKCDFFIGNGYSNVSLGISELKNWKNDRIKLLY